MLKLTDRAEYHSKRHMNARRDEWEKYKITIRILILTVAETAGGLSGKFAGSTLAPALATPVELNGTKDVYIQQDNFITSLPQTFRKAMHC